MRIVSKINIALSAVFASSVLFNYAILDWTVAPQFEAIEERAAKADYNRVVETISEQLSAIRIPASDYGAWDDSHAFVTGAMPDYAKVNLTPETFASLSLNLMLFIDRDGKVVWAGARDNVNATELTLPPFAQGPLRMDDPLLSPMQTLAPASAVVSTPLGLMLVGVAPITKSDRKAPAVGVLAVARFLDVDQIRSQTKVDFSVAERSRQDLDPLQAKLNAMLATDSQSRAKIVEDNQIVSASLLTDLTGAAVAMLTVRSPRDVTATGNAVLSWAVLEMVVVGALILIALRTLLNRIAILRLERLRSHFTEVTTTGDLTSFESKTSDDELGTLQKCFNDMVGQVNELKNRLTEQSFHSGRAEVASSTLHNLRNSLSPISTLARLMREDEGAEWWQNIQRAAAELDEPGIASERSAKLEAYLVKSARRMAQDGAERSERLQRIIDAAADIENLLAGQDHLARADQPIEPLSTVDLISRASASALQSPGVKIDFDLPDAGPHVLGHRVLLQQVLENLFANAGEAIAATGRKAGRITVKVTAGDEIGRPSVEIRISDTGDGIAASRLDKIFNRGQSTRQNKNGGLGLHWCANTIAAMGGRLYATSPGVGQGASLHLVLPMSQSSVKKAA